MKSDLASISNSIHLSEFNMTTIELSSMQIKDLIKVVIAKQKTLNLNGDRPYWKNIEDKLSEALTRSTRIRNI